MARLPDNIRTRKVAILATDGVNAAQVAELRKKLSGEGASGLVIAPSMAPVSGAGGDSVASDAMLDGLPSMAVDPVIVAGGADSARRLGESGSGRHYLRAAFKHLKVIAALADGRQLLEAAGIPKDDEGMIIGDQIGDVSPAFVKALSNHRVWSRNDRANAMPA